MSQLWTWITAIEFERAWLAWLALLAAPAVAADAGSGTFVGTIDKKPVSITFKEVYAFRAEGSRKEQQIVVYLTDRTPTDSDSIPAG